MTALQLRKREGSGRAHGGKRNAKFFPEICEKRKKLVGRPKKGRGSLKDMSRGTPFQAWRYKRE